MSFRLYGPNIMRNSDFETGVKSYWTVYYNTASGASGSSSVTSLSPYAGNYSLMANVNSMGVSVNDVQIIQNGVPTRAGENWALRFAIKAEAIKAATLSYLLGLSPYTMYYSVVLSLTADYQALEHTFTLASDVASGSVRFLVGSGTDPIDIFVDNVTMHSYIDLPVRYDGFEAGEQLTRADARALAGGLYTYIEPQGFNRWSLPLTHVTSAERNLITGWWASGAALLLAPDASYPFSCHTVRVTNAEEPLATLTAPYGLALYAGELVLETV